MKLTVIGAGYVGLVSGACLASLGVKVTCVDRQQEKIDMLNRGQVPIYEPGLAKVISSGMATGHLCFTSDLPAAVQGADMVMIAVGTPPDPNEAGKADLQYVFAVGEEIARHLNGYTIIATKSTVPVGTNARLRSLIAETNPDGEFDIASNPEFLREGSAIDDFMHPDRIVVGVYHERAGHVLAELYRPLTNAGYPLLQTDVETAEMIKYASNSFLATKIAFINEMADICEHVGANVEHVAKGMGMDARIGDKFLQPGPGFGGSCFPKDAMALARLAEHAGVKPHIINTVIDYNLGRRDSMAARIIAACGGSVNNKRIGILGLTFKAHTDDMRESAALSIIPQLINAGASISVTDPEGLHNAKLLLGDAVQYCSAAEAVAQDAHALAIVTEWPHYAALDWQQLKKIMAYPRLIDLRNLYSPADVAAQGFDYFSIGRKPALGTAKHQ